MTVMPGYQILWTMSIIILLESLPMLSTNVYIFGAELLLDEENDVDLYGGFNMNKTIQPTSNNNNNDNIDDNLDDDLDDELGQTPAIKTII